MNSLVGEAYLASSQKRKFEWSIAMGITPPAAVLMALGASAFYAENRINPIFVQERDGQGVQPIKLFKLRSFPSLEDLADQSAGDTDPRASRVGRILRKSKIDDLAALWNFYKGELALVGPRPIVPQETLDTYALLSPTDREDWVHARTIARAGAVSAFNKVGRTLEPASEKYLLARVEADITYAEQASIVVDTKIMLDAVGGALARVIGRTFNSPPSPPLDGL